MEILVYTAISGGKDKLKKINKTDEDNIKYVAYLDEITKKVTPIDVLESWDEIRPIIDIHYSHLRDRQLNLKAKYHKLHPFLHPFDKYDVSIWLDGSVNIKEHAKLREVIDEGLRDNDIAFFKHPTRSCVYDEANACVQLGKDDARIIYAQVEKYRYEGMPQHYGLPECTIILRRNTNKIDAFNNLWWNEVADNSMRDQISVSFVAWKLGTQFTLLEGTVQDQAWHPNFPGNKWFSYNAHEI